MGSEPQEDLCPLCGSIGSTDAEPTEMRWGDASVDGLVAILAHRNDIPVGSIRSIAVMLHQFGVRAPVDEDTEDSCEDERRRLAFYDAKHFEAAEAIKASDKWADNHWPSTADRIWYVEAQEEIERLRRALSGAGSPPEDVDAMHLALRVFDKVSAEGWAVVSEKEFGKAQMALYDAIHHPAASPNWLAEAADALERAAAAMEGAAEKVGSSEDTIDLCRRAFDLRGLAIELRPTPTEGGREPQDVERITEVIRDEILNGRHLATPGSSICKAGDCLPDKCGCRAIARLPGGEREL
jgi:hypothetical protein